MTRGDFAGFITLLLGIYWGGAALIYHKDGEVAWPLLLLGLAVALAGVLMWVG